MSPAPPGPPPPRVRVTSSRRGTTIPRRRRPALDLDEQTELGDIYLGGLMRAQGRLALTVAGLAVAAIVGFTLVLLVSPGTRSLTLGGLPIPWLVLWVIVFPCLYLLARWYCHQAERIEAEFRDIVERE